jgi:Leucine-rich repeat (LRR) protein
MKIKCTLLFFLVFAWSNAQNVNIPDPYFKNILINGNVNTNGDDEIQLSEAQAAVDLHISNQNITDLTGLEEFTGLATLSISYVQTSNIDVSFATSLESLSIYSTPINSIDLSNNTLLLDLSLNYNNLSSLDVSSNILLEEISCTNNALSTVNLLGLSSLERLHLRDNQLSSLDVLQLSNLEFLDVRNNLLTNIDLANNTNLHQVFILNNMLGNINLGVYPNLENLDLSDNQLDAIDGSGCNSLTHLYLKNNQFVSVDISNLSLLKHLRLNGNQLTNLDVSLNTELLSLSVSENELTNVDLVNNLSLNMLDCEGNNIQNLDLNLNTQLGELFCANNQLESLILGGSTWELDCSNNLLTHLDLSQEIFLQNFNFSDNLLLNSLNFKNGRNDWYNYYDVEGSFYNLPNLQVVCVDDLDLSFTTDLQNLIPQELIFTEYCSFNPGGEFYMVSGTSTLDFDGDGCDELDPYFPNVSLHVSNGSENTSFYSDDNGNYVMPIEAGNYTITPQIENSSYFSISPSTISVNLPADTDPLMQNFCLTSNGVFNDLELVLIPLEEARPGFDANYKLLYKNKGTTTLNGTVNLSFEHNYMSLLNATPTVTSQNEGNLSWDFNNLLPLESREILFTMTLNTPTDDPYPLNSGDILSFVSAIDFSDIDETPEDNSFSLDQIVVNSYDPNDKQCLQGSSILIENVGSYVHYLIRFENTGTANAMNVVVKDAIDIYKYDLASLIPLNGSHEFYTRINNNNEVEFIFENIDLPFDDANNDGFVLFKIRTLDVLIAGDEFSNTAEIYFDYNAAIITNTEVTEVQDNLGLDDYSLKSQVKLFPNPISDYFNIELPDNIEIDFLEIFNVSGNAIMKIDESNRYDVSNLSPGIYILKINTNKGTLNQKLIKR